MKVKGCITGLLWWVIWVILFVCINKGYLRSLVSLLKGRDSCLDSALMVWPLMRESVAVLHQCSNWEWNLGSATAKLKSRYPSFVARQSKSNISEPIDLPVWVRNPSMMSEKVAMGNSWCFQRWTSAHSGSSKEMQGLRSVYEEILEAIRHFITPSKLPLKALHSLIIQVRICMNDIYRCPYLKKWEPIWTSKTQTLSEGSSFFIICIVVLTTIILQ